MSPLDLKGERGPVSTRIILQVGHTGSTYYLAEPASPGSGGVNASGSELWKYVQQATVTAKAPRDVTIEAGLFPSPIGLEVIAIKDNWNWSRSNLFFGLPFYHTGARVSRPLGGGLDRHARGLQRMELASSTTTRTRASRSRPRIRARRPPRSSCTSAASSAPTGAPEGKPWRHLFDALIQTSLTDQVSVAAQADAGFEPNDIGTSSWVAGALYGKLALSDELYAAVRGDYFYEKVAEDNGTTASSIFWPTKWVAEGTATLAYQPARRRLDPARVPPRPGRHRRVLRRHRRLRSDDGGVRPESQQARHRHARRHRVVLTGGSRNDGPALPALDRRLVPLVDLDDPGLRPDVKELMP